MSEDQNRDPEGRRDAVITELRRLSGRGHGLSPAVWQQWFDEWVAEEEGKRK